MLDIKWIRENPEAFDKALKNRGLEAAAHKVVILDEGRRKAIQAVQDLQNQRNLLAKQIGDRKRLGENADTLMNEATLLREKLTQEEGAVTTLEEEVKQMLSFLPNVPSADVPFGTSEKDNVEVRLWGEKPTFSFEPKQHFEIGENLGLMNFARLERALGNFMLDVHTKEYGYLEVSPPYMVRGQAMFGAGQLPKFAEDAFVTTNDYWLIPTAEVPLTNLVAEDILDLRSLPLRFVAYTPCFRSEAGSAASPSYISAHISRFIAAKEISYESVAEHIANKKPPWAM